jgi:hypothetical protein
VSNLSSTALYSRDSLHAIDCSPNHVGIHETVLNGFLGLDILVDAWRQNPSSTLHAALFMNALRLYIHVALVNKRPLPQAIPSCCLTSSICPSPEDPRVVNARVTVLVAKILDYCYDDEPKTRLRWQALDDDLAEWKTNLPASFQPMLETRANASQPFGSILFANDVHGKWARNSKTCAHGFVLITIAAASHQYYCLAKQLLVKHTPTNEEGMMPTFSSENAILAQGEPILNQTSQQAETIDLLRACAVAEAHMDAMGIILMSTLPILACE